MSLGRGRLTGQMSGATVFFAGTRILSGSVSPYDPRGMIILSFIDITPPLGSISSEPDTNSGVFGGSVTASRPAHFLTWKRGNQILQWGWRF